MLKIDACLQAIQILEVPLITAAGIAQDDVLLIHSFCSCRQSFLLKNS